MRLPLGRALVGAVVLVGLASPAGAGESVPGGARWGGSSVQRPDAVTDPSTSTVSIAGTLRDRGNLLGRPAMAATFAVPPGCPGVPDVGLAVHGGGLATSRSFSGSGPFPNGACNGAYRVAVLIDGGEVMDTQLVVDLPAPVVTGVVAKAGGGGRSITVTWEDARAQAPDLEGYAIERKIGSGDFEPVAGLAADATRYVDDELPTNGGEATYRVSSQRPSPDGTNVSAASTSEPATFRPRPATDPGDGDGDGNGEEPGEQPGDGDGPGGQPGEGEGPGDQPGDAPRPGDVPAGGGGIASGPRPQVSAPRIGFSRSFLPPLLTPRVSPDQLGRPTTPTTADDGFDDELPYDPIDGPLEAEVPDDELAGFFTETVPGRGMAIPVATALVLAGWAMHLRALARAGRPID